MSRVSMSDLLRGTKVDAKEAHEIMLQLMVALNRNGIKSANHVLLSFFNDEKIEKEYLRRTSLGKALDE